MVRINRIVLQGFKSFNRKASILLAPGLTVVCGPNASGKSNLVDAICFVLGTISSKSLRADRLQELIFRAKGRQAEQASVTLYFDNSDRIFPFEEQEVSITRKANKQGMCVYKIQGRTKTRQEVLELLAMVGLRPDGYNIIQQGEITRLIEMSPIERRQIIDQISGIADYREKKERAERELQVVEQKLREVQLVLEERSDLFKRLEEESKAAKLYEELRYKLELLEASLLYQKLREVQQRCEKFRAKKESKEQALQVLENELSMLGAAIEEREARLEQISECLLNFTKQLKARQQQAKVELELGVVRQRLEQARQLLSELDATLPEQVKVPDQFLTALKAVLPPGSVIVEGVEEAVKKVKELESKLGKRWVLILDRLKQGQKGNTLGEVVDAPSSLKSWLDQKLVDDLKAALREQKAVTPSGLIVERGAVWVGRDAVEELKQRLEQEVAELVEQEAELTSKLESLPELKVELASLEAERKGLHSELEKLKGKYGKLMAQREELRESLKRAELNCARAEVEAEGLVVELKQYEHITKYVEQPISALKRELERTKEELKKLGPINLRAPQLLESLRGQLLGLREKYERVLQERDAVLRMVEEVEQKRRQVFYACLNEVCRHFKEVYHELTGGEAALELEDPLNLESGLLMKASPAGKSLLNIDLMSGGEKTMTALAFLFALQRYRPAPFYVLDEADAALDKENSKLLGELLQKFSKQAQFLVITHNDITISYGDVVYGASMVDGETKLLSLRMPSA